MIRFRIIKQNLGLGSILNLLITFTISRVTSLALYIVVLSNLEKFKSTKIIFVNSYAFGHSIAETSAFFYTYKQSSMCISIGHIKNRNKYFKYIYEPQILLHFWLPNLLSTWMNHALRKRVHISISTNLQRSRILRLVLKSNIKCIEREELLDEFVNNELISNYQFSRAYSSELVEKFKLDYISCNNKHSSSLQFLTQRKNLLSTVLPSKFDISIRKFHTVMDKKILIDSDDKIGLCTLILRKSEKPWSGLGLEGYEEIIRFLNFNGYIVNIIGDIGSQCESWRKNKNIKLYYHMDYKLNPKVFQILSVYFSEFCIGDLSGAQVLPHFFNKKNLIFNAIPIGQFQYNSTIVPKIWMKNGIKCTMDQHFNELLFRYKNFRSANNEHFSTHFLPNDIMLKAVKVFISEADRLSCDFKGINKLDFTNDEKSLLHYAQASTISSVYIEFLNS